MTERRIVITGIGVVSPLGNSKEEFWKNLAAGKSGIRNIQAFDTTPRSGRLGMMVYSADGRVCDATFGEIERQ